MPVPYIATQHITAGAGAEGDVTALTVPDGYIFRLNRVEILFPSGTVGELEISIYQGIHKTLPDEGVWTGDHVLLKHETERRWGSGEDVVIHYKNLNTTAARECFVYLIGELEA